jgi:hypothetical protein
MLPPQLQLVRLQLQNTRERTSEQNRLLDEIEFLDHFANELIRRIGVTAPPGPTTAPTHCRTCGKPLP